MEWELEEIISWWDRVYARTLEVAQAVPAEWLDWRPTPEEFSPADLIRHLASTELMNLARLGSGKLAYGGHGPEHGRTKAEVIAYLEECHAQAVALLRQRGESGLSHPVPTNQGSIAGWRVLVGMLEHEIHHRSQLCSYLSRLGISPPPLYGLYVEELPTT